MVLHRNIKSYFLLIGLFIACNDNAVILPSIGTIPITDIGIKAKTGGVILVFGSTPITEQGVCWSETQNPTIEDNVVIDDSNEEVFAVEIKWLKAGTTYYVRSFARTAGGIAYGQEEEFTTPEYSSPPRPIGETDNTDGDCQEFINNAGPGGTACCLSGATSGNPGDVLVFKLFTSFTAQAITWFIVAGEMTIVDGEGTEAISLLLADDFTEGYVHVAAESDLGSDCAIPVHIRLK